AGKLSQVKGIRQEKDQQRPGKKDIPAKDKAIAIYMIRSWRRVTRQKVTQSFDRIREIMFPPLTANEGAEGPLVIESEIGGHTVHHKYVDGDAEHSTEAWMNFMIVRSPSPYNGGVKGGVVTIRSTIFSPMECATVTATPKNIEEKTKKCLENFQVAIHPDFPD
ncbi:hypothetical protein Tco_0994538, partial [Tanacetum coccineum]